MFKKLIGNKAFYKMTLGIAVPMMIQNLISNYPIIIYIVAAALLFGIIVLVNIPSSTSYGLTLTAWIVSFIGIFVFRKIDMIK